MAKSKSSFFCGDCGHETANWAGQCPNCQAWNTIVEAPTEGGDRPGPRRSARRPTKDRPSPQVLEGVDGTERSRIATQMDEFDFVLGGGIVPGSIVLLGGAPGIGKSTILTQVAAQLQAAGDPVLYVSGEESARQVKLRAERIGQGADQITYLGEPEVGHLLRHAREFQPSVLVVDSIQTLYDADIDSAPGNLKQVKECAATLQQYAKSEGVAVFLVGHVTKGGSIAGPKTLEHIVDTVIYFEQTSASEHRIMRAAKNRFGSVDEIGVFRMTETGLVPVPNPSEIFLGERRSGGPGSVVTATVEGSRPVLIEVQGLSSVAAYGSPQRVATGYARKRLSILLAVLEKRADLPFSQLDAFVNVVGGLQLQDTAGDAAIALALASSAADRAVPADTLVLGEVGLGGELRRVGRIERRLTEAARLGFTRACVPEGAAPRESVPGLEVIETGDVGQLIETVIGPVGAQTVRKTGGEEKAGATKGSSDGRQPKKRSRGAHRTELEI